MNEYNFSQLLNEKTDEEISESEDEEDDDDQFNVDMAEAEKATKTKKIPLVDVVTAIKRKIKLNLRNSKKTKAVKVIDKDLVRLSTRS